VPTARSIRGLVALLAGLVCGAGCFPLSALLIPEPHGDMEARLRSFPFPPDFLLLGSEKSGMRTNFMAGSPPEVEVKLAAPWSDGRLCDQLRELVASVGTLYPNSWQEEATERYMRQAGTLSPEDRSCHFQAIISSGWRGKLLGIWSYRIDAHGASPSFATKYIDKADCEQLRRQGYRIGNLSSWLYARVECFLPPGYGYARLAIISGHFLADWM